MVFFLKQRKNAVGVSSNKLVQSHPGSLFEEPLLFIPKKYMFPMVSRINSVNKNVQCPALDLHYPMTCQKIPGTVVFWGKSQGLEGVPTMELWNCGTVEPESPSPSPLRGWTGSHHREESKEFGLGKALRVEEVDVLMGTGNGGGSQLNQQTSIGSRLKTPLGSL